MKMRNAFNDERFVEQLAAGRPWFIRRVIRSKCSQIADSFNDLDKSYSELYGGLRRFKYAQSTHCEPMINNHIGDAKSEYKYLSHVYNRKVNEHNGKIVEWLRYVERLSGKGMIDMPDDGAWYTLRYENGELYVN